MRILMVYCNAPQDNVVPIGITQLVSCLMEAGHEVELFHTTFYHQGFKSSTELRIEALHYKPCKIDYEPLDMCEDFRARIKKFKPELIGFSVVEPTFYIFKKLLDSIGGIIKLDNIRIAVGGVHAIFWPESLEGIESIDFISISEAEKSFVDLCDTIERGGDYSNQPGFWIRTGKKWNKNPPVSLTDLDSLPVLSLSAFGDRYLMKPMMGDLRRTITIELSRGCIYRCTYCGDAYLTDKFRSLGRWHRLKSIPKIEAEYAELIEKYRPEFVYKMSESFLAIDKNRLNAYRDVYNKYRLPFWAETRPETINEDNAKLLADMNCIRLSLGLESGNEEYRRKYLNRNYSNAQVEKAAKILKKYGISFSMNLIIGFPFETRKMVFDGVSLLRRIKPDGISTFLFTPYKGCSLRRLCEDSDMIDRDFMGEDYFQKKYALRNNTFGSEIVGLWRTLPLYVHLPESRYAFIKKAEKLDAAGDKIFGELKEEYYEIMGWSKDAGKNLNNRS